MKIDFCSACVAARNGKVYVDHDAETGLCDRHEKPIRGVQMKCIHCTCAETTAYGDACPQCGNPCVGELAEPAIVLEEGEESSTSERTGTGADCDCTLVREADGSVRLYQCKLHHGAKDLEASFDEVCTQMGCEIDDIPEKFVQVCAERDKALKALGVDDELEGDDLDAAVSEASENFDPDMRGLGEKLLALVGFSVEEWTRAFHDSYWEGRFDPVNFLVSRLQALAPGKLAKELQPRAPRAKRSRKAKAPEPDGGVRLRETFDSNGRLSSIGVDTGETGLRLVKR